RSHLLVIYLLWAANSYVWVWQNGLGGWHRLGVGAECGISEVAVSLHIGERLPHHLALREEALISHQQEQLTGRTYIMSVQRVKMIVSEENTQFVFLHYRGQFSQAMVCQLGCRSLQELLGSKG
ncbi:hypothetical protein EGW08_001627, partial [Elysia chlorotica]